MFTYASEIRMFTKISAQTDKTESGKVSIQTALHRHLHKGNILRIPATLVLMWIIGYFMLVICYSIPTGRMENHTKNSAFIFQKEGHYPQLTGINVSQLDNFTDALMLLTAAHPRDKNVWVSAVDAARYCAQGQDPVETLINMSGNNGIDLETKDYQRYWHGYLIFLKPLLLFFDYSQIRYLIMAGQMFLFSLLLSGLAVTKKELVIPTVFLWLFLNPIATMCSLQFNNIVMITFIAMLLILRLKTFWKKDMDKWTIFFLCIGGITSYIDLLTYPLVSLGIPLILWLASCDENTSIRDHLQHVLQLSFFWCIGYGGMWAGKWILGSMISGNDVISNALATILFRTSPFLSSESSDKITYLMILARMWEYSGKCIMMSLIVACSYFCVYKLLNIPRLKLRNTLPYALMGIYPFVWFFVLRNHSFIHVFFTYRELAVTAYAIMVLAALKDKHKLSEKGDAQFNHAKSRKYRKP